MKCQACGEAITLEQLPRAMLTWEMVDDKAVRFRIDHHFEDSPLRGRRPRFGCYREDDFSCHVRSWSNFKDEVRRIRGRAYVLGDASLLDVVLDVQDAFGV